MVDTSRKVCREVVDRDVADLVIRHTKERLEELYNAELYLKQNDYLNSDSVRVLLNAEQGFRMPRRELLKAVRASIERQQEVLEYWEKEGAE